MTVMIWISRQRHSIFLAAAFFFWNLFPTVRFLSRSFLPLLWWRKKNFSKKDRPDRSERLKLVTFFYCIWTRSALVAAAATTHSAVTDVIADGSLLHAAPHPWLYHLLPASFFLRPLRQPTTLRSTVFSLCFFFLLLFSWKTFIHSLFVSPSPKIIKFENWNALYTVREREGERRKGLVWSRD